MYRKKRCILVTALLGAALLLQGCASRTDSGKPDTSILPASLQNLSFDEHLDISIGYWDIENIANSPQADGILQYIEDLFNITITPISVTWANYKERYQSLSATDSLPDVFATLTLSSNDTNDSAIYTDMIANGSIRALPEDLSAFPTLNDLLDSVPYTKYTDGSYYAIPRVAFTDPMLSATDAAMLVRKDWMEHLGLDAPESFDEFLELTAAFAHSDPDGNGIDDTIGYNASNPLALGKWVILGIAPECNVYSWVAEDGRYVPSWYTENFKDVVASYRKLYEREGLDPDFFTKTGITASEDFASDRLGALECKSSPAAIMAIKEIWDELNEKPFEDCVDVLPIFPASDGIRYSNSSSIFWSESYLSGAADDSKTERILALFEFLLSDTGQEICHYGLEGIDYRLTEDGSYEYLLDIENGNPGTALLKKYPSLSLFSAIASWGGGWEDFEENELNYLRYGEASVKLAHKSAEWYQENTTQLSRPYSFLLYPKEPSIQFSTTQAFNDFINCIIGSGDPLDMWEQALDDMRGQGLEEYIDRQNENYERQEH